MNMLEVINFTLTVPIIFGEAKHIIFEGAPDRDLVKPRIKCNAPCEKFYFFYKVIIGKKIEIDIGEDGYNFNFNSISFMQFPTIKAGQSVKVIGVYTGLVPKGFCIHSQVNAAVTFRGQAVNIHNE